MAYLLNIFALSKVSPTITGSYAYVQPVVSFLMVVIYGYLVTNSEYSGDINVLKIISCILANNNYIIFISFVLRGQFGHYRN